MELKRKAMREKWGNDIIKVPYCNAQYLLAGEYRIGYSVGAYGWACDYFIIWVEPNAAHPIGKNIIISTGYSPIGNAIDYELLKTYEEKARNATPSERKELLQQWLSDELTHYYK